MADGEEKEQSQKTVEPTQRKIDEAVKKGQIAYSREITNFLMLLLLAFIIAWIGPMMMKDSTIWLTQFIEHPHAISVDSTNARRFTADISTTFMFIMILPILLSLFFAILSSMIQNGFIISSEPVMPKLEKISPFKGIKRIFSMKSFMEFVKGVIKIVVVGIITYIVVKPHIIGMDNLPGYALIEMLKFMGELCFNLIVGVCAFMFVMAVLDWLYQKFEYLKSLRMTKQELKEEYKQSEGDPIIKGRLKQIRMEKARQRMMTNVPKADVIITNPTHFAVALEYNESMMAPKLVAKGADFIAMQIRKIAEQNNIPIVRNPPLARALFDSVEIDEVIPEKHYKTVAEIIAYVFKLKKQKKAI